ncbi:MAG: MoxR family ATPase [Gammaproteobacteria bacterium]|nr:MoxR family ATPase [Gammaproteobacteria bacterium]MBT3723790.1 MoxR family ATPase [Gammaproteobacteria bacterium]MBT4075008.1 MoxR family ATPase [Gammaproteobacteria bacterium]MBT4196416.1 MoxR family ATPase [Gammaproteobacteria bacterium]MBT4448163.1 MoxR family ATPase [Gammaproteobacteria bacterium]
MQKSIHTAISIIETIIVGKPEQIRLAVCCLLSSGHCLIEDLPGVGKTTLSHALAKVFGLNFSRIQFTSDLLPADILGVSIFDPKSQAFNFHPGPIFSNCVLADEMNRATPKTQSALLEAMEERQITIDGSTKKLQQPFFVIGTQNPLDQSGTFPLPESQLDRFMMKLNLGYPDEKAERELLSGQNRQHLIHNLQPAITTENLIQLQNAVEEIHVSDALLDYVQLLVSETRNKQLFVYGLSPRAALSLLRAARAWALMNGRNFVEPGDIKAVFISISNHRLIPTEQHSKNSTSLVETLLQQISIP